MRILRSSLESVSRHILVAQVSVGCQTNVTLDNLDSAISSLISGSHLEDSIGFTIIKSMGEGGGELLRNEKFCCLVELMQHCLGLGYQVNRASSA